MLFFPVSFVILFNARRSLLIVEKPRVSRLRFSCSDDLALLRVVALANPFRDTGLWRSVQHHVVAVTGKNFSVRALREHLGHLVKLYTTNNRSILKKSGTEEQLTEKIQLLDRILELKKEFERKSLLEAKNSDFIRCKIEICSTDESHPPSDSTPSEIERNQEASTPQSSPSENSSQPLKIPDESLHTSSKRHASNSSETAMSEVPPRKKAASPTSALIYLERKLELVMEKSRALLELKEEEIRLREEKFKLQLQKFEIERKEREVNLEKEIERTNFLNQQQNLLLDMLLKQLNRQ